MTRLLSILAFFTVLSAPAFAGAAQAARPEPTAARQHAYWLSRDLQRLVFWQAPTRDARR